MLTVRMAAAIIVHLVGWEVVSLPCRMQDSLLNQRKDFRVPQLHNLAVVFHQVDSHRVDSNKVDFHREATNRADSRRVDSSLEATLSNLDTNLRQVVSSNLARWSITMSSPRPEAAVSERFLELESLALRLVLAVLLSMTH